MIYVAEINKGNIRGIADSLVQAFPPHERYILTQSGMHWNARGRRACRGRRRLRGTSTLPWGLVRFPVLIGLIICVHLGGQ